MFQNDDDEEELEKKKTQVGVTKKSIFDNKPKKSSQKDLEEKVKALNEKEDSYKEQGREFAAQFIQLLEDKTLNQNKTVFKQNSEKELLSNMINLAMLINNDQSEYEGMGSLGWITLLLKNNLRFRDRCNELEYGIFVLDKQIVSFKEQVLELQEKLDDLRILAKK